jgi:hypothetical protein
MLRNRWSRRGLVGLVVLVVVGVAWFVYHRQATHREGLRRLAEIHKHLDATDPYWHLDQIEAARGNLPDDQNSAMLMPQFQAALGGKDFLLVRPGRNSAGVFVDVPPNRVLDDDGAIVLDEALDGKGAALAIAWSFKDYARGQKRYTYTPDFLGTLTPGLQEARSVVALLEAEAERYCRDKRPGAAFDLTRSMLGACRSIDPHPFLVAGLVRIACEAVTVRRLERTLGLTEPKARLVDVQAELLRESETDIFWASVRGERAGMDMFFTNLRAGRLPPGTRGAIAGGPGGRRPTLFDQLRALTDPGRDTAAHAEYLEVMTRIHEARHLSEPEQRAAIRAVAIPAPTEEDGLARMLLPSLSNLHDASLRSKAQLRCAAVGLAVERYRQLTGSWPATLAEIPKDMLPAIPRDPFDGQPLKYARRADGVTVYSIGQDGQDDGGIIIDGANPTRPGSDVGFRLYNPDARGLPPLPRPKLDFEQLGDIHDVYPDPLVRPLPFPRVVDDDGD